MELELKHLAAYWAFKLKVKLYGDNGLSANLNLTSDLIAAWEKDKFIIKPVLRPLPDLMIEDEIEISFLYKIISELEGRCDAYDEWYDAVYDNGLEDKIMQAPYELIEKLLSLHYDVFNLIPNNLAIDINTL